MPKTTENRRKMSLNTLGKWLKSLVFCGSIPVFSLKSNIYGTGSSNNF